MRKVTYLSVLLPALVGLCSIAGAQCSQNCPERPTISVAGTGQVTADADVAVIHVGFKLFAPDAKSAYDTSNAVMQALTASGVSKAAIESSSQVLQHTQPYDMQPFPMKDEERQRRQFTVMQSWTIRVAPDQASSTLNAAVNAGANESGWIQWIVNNPSDLQAQAAAKAVVNAHDRRSDCREVECPHRKARKRLSEPGAGTLRGFGERLCWRGSHECRVHGRPHAIGRTAISNQLAPRGVHSHPLRGLCHRVATAVSR